MNEVTIDTSLVAHNETDKRANEIIRLLGIYIPAFREIYYGHRPIGSDDLVFPCAMIEPTMIDAHMVTTAKYDQYFTFDIYFYVLHDERNALVTLQTDFAETLIKLFSNNALSELDATGYGNVPFGSGPYGQDDHPTNRFKTNPGFWVNSEMQPIRLSPTFNWTRPDRPHYCRAGVFELKLWDRFIK